MNQWQRGKYYGLQKGIIPELITWNNFTPRQQRRIKKKNNKCGESNFLISNLL